MKSRTTTLVAVTVAGIAGLAWVISLMSSPKAPGLREAGPHDGAWGLLSTVEGAGDGAEGDGIADDPLVNRFTVERAPLIHDVIVDKSAVCAGEEVSIRVTGANPGGKDSHLLYRIAGRPGDRAVLSFSRPGTKEIHVVAGDEGTKLDFRKVTVEVLECQAKKVLTLTSRPGAANPDEIEFVAHLESGAKASGFRWSFGDGTSIETDGPRVRHSYFSRDQKRFASSFEVSVKAAGGEARTVVTLANVHFIAGEMGTPLVPVMAERIARWQGPNLVTSLSVKNIHAGSLNFTDAEITAYGADGAEKAIEVGVLSSILSLPAIAAGDTREGTLSLPKALLPAGASALRIKLQGSLPGGGTSSALVHLTVPPDPSKGKARGDMAVTDRNMVRKLEKARAILGPGKPITAEEMAGLEAEGRL